MKNNQKTVRLDAEVINELQRRYPGSTPNAALREILGLPYRKSSHLKRKRNRLIRALRTLVR